MSDYDVYFSRGEGLVYISTFHSLAAAKRYCESAFRSGDVYGTDLQAAYVDSSRWSHVLSSGVWSRRSLAKKVVHL